jgi:asparagine synthase (glutamine-hydrolysing)
MDEFESQVVRSLNVDAFFSGLGGDTVFYCSYQALGAIDYAFLHPFGSGSGRELAASTRLSKESIWRVTSKMVKHGLLHRRMPPIFDPLQRPHLLKDDVAKTFTPDYYSHPWLDHADWLPPGKYNHVNGVVNSTLFYPFVFHSERCATSVNPLTSQPVVELSMRIPTYVLLSGGVTRGLARKAFADLLPAAIRKRTVKGYSFAFWQQLLRKRIEFLRESLMEGALAREGLLDRQKLDSYLVREQPFLTVIPVQVMGYLACEAWLRQWNKRPVANPSEQDHTAPSLSARAI